MPRLRPPATGTPRRALSIPPGYRPVQEPDHRLRPRLRGADAGEIRFQDSGLDWTTVHPGFFFPGPKTERPLVPDAATGYKLPGLARTTQADVAQVMLRILTDPVNGVTPPATPRFRLKASLGQ